MRLRCCLFAFSLALVCMAMAISVANGHAMKFMSAASAFALFGSFCWPVKKGVE